MPITLLFEPKAGADVLYDGVISALKEQGSWPPEGLRYHVASGTGADFISVPDVRRVQKNVVFS